MAFAWQINFRSDQRILTFFYGSSWLAPLLFFSPWMMTLDVLRCLARWRPSLGVRSWEDGSRLCKRVLPWALTWTGANTNCRRTDPVVPFCFYLRIVVFSGGHIYLKAWVDVIMGSLSPYALIRSSTRAALSSRHGPTTLPKFFLLRPSIVAEAHLISRRSYRTSYPSRAMADSLTIKSNTFYRELAGLPTYVGAQW